jgi:hypothetical protein
MTEFGHIAYRGPGFRVDTWGAGPFVIKAGGKSWRFEDSDRFGPALCRKNGDLLANPYPPERSPFWAAHLAWVRQGRRVAEDGEFCVWEPLRPTKVRHIGGARHVVVEHGDPDGAQEVVP